MRGRPCKDRGSGVTSLFVVGEVAPHTDDDIGVVVPGLAWCSAPWSALRRPSEETTHRTQGRLFQNPLIPVVPLLGGGDLEQPRQSRFRPPLVGVLRGRIQ